MIENIGVVASGILKGICQNWHPVEGTVSVDAFGKGNNSGGEPRGVNEDGPEGVAKDVSEEADLLLALEFCCRHNICGVTDRCGRTMGEYSTQPHRKRTPDMNSGIQGIRSLPLLADRASSSAAFNSASSIFLSANASVISISR